MMDDNKVHDLIAAVKSYPILYDPNHPQFRHKEEKDKYWKTIAKHFKTTSLVVDKKWQYLKYQMVKRTKEEMEGRVNSRPWAWAEEMAFIRPFIKMYRRRSNAPDHRAPEVMEVAVDPVAPNAVTVHVNQQPIVMSEDTQDMLLEHFMTTVPANSASEGVADGRENGERRETRQRPAAGRKGKAGGAPSPRIVEITTPEDRPRREIPAKRRFEAGAAGGGNANGLCRPATSSATSDDTGQLASRLAVRSNGTAGPPAASPRGDQARPSVGADAGAPLSLEALDYFMLKCAKRMKQLPPEVQAELQIHVSQVISIHENQL